MAAVAASVQADRAQLLFRLAGSSPCVVGDWPRIDLLVLKDGTCVKELWHAPTHCVAAAQCAARRAGQRRTTTMHSLHSQRSTCAVLHNLASVNECKPTSACQCWAVGIPLHHFVFRPSRSALTRLPPTAAACSPFHERSNHKFGPTNGIKDRTERLLSWYIHGLRTPGEEIAFTEWPKIYSYSQIFRTVEAYFVCHIGPNFQISLMYAFIGCL